MPWSTLQNPSGAALTVRPLRDGAPVPFREVLGLWRHDAEFVAFHTRQLASSPLPAFRWETPPITMQTAEQPFEYTLSPAPELLVASDPGPFQAHLPPRGSGRAAAFPSLGGDAILVIPAEPEAGPGYPHLAAFVRTAPASAQRSLWAEVGAQAAARLSERPVWISTAGAGVSWLHVRLDDRPKYYRHAAYRRG